MTKSYHSQIYFNNILGIYLNEKLIFCYHILVTNVEISDTRIFLMILKYDSNHQHSSQ